MDVAGAFNNVHVKMQLYNLRKKRMPNVIVRWVESFLSERSTNLRFNRMDLNKISIEAGVPQRSRISLILYLFYNTDLLEIPGKINAPGRKGASWRFINDIAYGIQDGSEEEILKEAEGCREKHGTHFEPSKYILMRFTMQRKTLTTSITIENTTINPVQKPCYFGVIFDRKLKFGDQVQQATKEGMKFTIAISRIAKSTWGI